MGFLWMFQLYTRSIDGFTSHHECGLYAHTIKYKLINCSWTVVGWMAAVGKGPHLLQKNPQQNFLATGLCVHVYVYKCVVCVYSVCTSVCACMYVCVYVNVCMCVCVYMCVYVFCVCVYVCMCLCVCVCVYSYLCMHVCMYMCICTQFFQT